MLAPDTQAPLVTEAIGAEPAGLPSTWLGVSAGGDVAFHLTDAGLAIAGLGQVEGASGAWTVPSSNTVYVAYCCEPAGGNGYRVDEQTALQDRVSAFAGYSAVPDPTGQWVAVPQQVGLYLQAESTDEPSRHVTDTLATRQATVAWLPGSKIAWIPQPDADPRTIEVIDLDDSDRVASVQLPELWDTTIAAGPAGTLFFAGCREEPAVGEACEQSVLGSLDIASQAATLLADLDPGARLGGSDPSGTALIYVDGMGWAWWWSATDRGFLGEGFVAATWASS